MPAPGGLSHHLGPLGLSRCTSPLASGLLDHDLLPFPLLTAHHDAGSNKDAATWSCRRHRMHGRQSDVRAVLRRWRCNAAARTGGGGAMRLRVCGAEGTVAQRVLMRWRTGGEWRRRGRSAGGVRECTGGGERSGCTRGGRRWRRGCARGGRRRTAAGGESEGEGAVKTERRQKRESERVAVSRQESNMTCGPRRFSYRRLIRRLGFEHRLIASV
jgi:hypothetical protein